MKRSLENSDRLVNTKIQELQIMDSVLGATNQKILQLYSEIEGLKSQLAAALQQNEKLSPSAIDVELQSQLEQERADRQKIEAELSQLKQNSPLPARLFDKSTVDTAVVLNEIRTRRKKLKINMEDLRVILEILESSAKKIDEE